MSGELAVAPIPIGRAECERDSVRDERQDYQIFYRHVFHDRKDL